MAQFVSTARTPGWSARPTVRATSRSEPAPVPCRPGYGFQAQPLPGQPPPRREQPLGDVGAAGGQGPDRFGGGTEQHHQVLVGVRAQDRSGHRQGAVGLGVRGGHQRHSQVHPAAFCASKFCASKVVRRGGSVTCTPPCTGVRGRPADGPGGPRGATGDVDSEDGPAAGCRGGREEEEADRTCDGVPAGRRECRHPALSGALYEGAGEGSAVAGAVAGHSGAQEFRCSARV